MRQLLCVVSAAGALSLAACAGQAAGPPFKPVANVDQLMDATIQPAADAYWGAVSTVVDKDGVHENFPRTDEEWEKVWAGAMTIAESGNLLMMAPRAKDDADWMKFSAAMVDIGQEAAKIAESKNPEAVLEVGERVYNVCTQCHMKYIVEEEE